MSEGKQPIGTASAIYTDDRGSTRMLPIGEVFRTKRGNLLFRLEVTPVVWEDPHVPRQVVIKLRDGSTMPTRPRPTSPTTSSTEDDFPILDDDLPF